MHLKKSFFLSIARYSFCLFLTKAHSACPMYLQSKAWAPGETIPTPYTCHGKNISPPLRWGNLPPQTKTLVLVVEDPDTPTLVWTHWIAYNIPSKFKGFPADCLPRKGEEGLNSWGKDQYNGPCPHKRAHTYVFTLYALNTQLQFDDPPTKQAVKKAMEGHILGEATLTGRYKPG